MLNKGEFMNKLIRIVFAGIILVMGINNVYAKRIGVGDEAPDFTLLDQDSKEISLTDFRGKNVVLYFYPKDDTGFCKKQACAFRDSYEDFVDEGAVVIGVSGDDIPSHKAFANKRKLPFTLLSDPGNKVARSYGVKKALGLIMLGRVTFVIDKEGQVRYRYSKLLEHQEHIDKALAMVKSLK